MKKCYICDNENKENDKYCRNCGNLLKTNKEKNINILLILVIIGLILLGILIMIAIKVY